MKIERYDNQIALEFVKTITEIASKLPEDNILYWGRKEQELEEILVKEVQLLTEVDLHLTIEPQKECNAFDTFYKKTPFSSKEDTRYCFNRAKDYFKEYYDQTDKAETSAYRINCRLETHEVLGYLSRLIDGRQYLETCSFTPSQIRKSASLLPGMIRKRIEELNFNAYNFLISGKNSRLGIMKIWQSDGRWKYNFGFDGALSLDLRENEVLMIV